MFLFFKLDVFLAKLNPLSVLMIELTYLLLNFDLTHINIALRSILMIFLMLSFEKFSIDFSRKLIVILVQTLIETCLSYFNVLNCHC